MLSFVRGITDTSGSGLRPLHRSSDGGRSSEAAGRASSIFAYRRRKGHDWLWIVVAALVVACAFSYIGFWFLLPSTFHHTREVGLLTCRARGSLVNNVKPLLSLPGQEVNQQTTLARRRLYESMSSQLLAKGMHIGGLATQGVSHSSLFKEESGQIVPVFHRLQVPVRAAVMPLLDKEASNAIFSAVQRYIVPLVDATGIWLQNSSLYHSTLYHASTHQDPVVASSEDVQEEVRAISAAAANVCPLRIAIERVVVTPTGNVLACWQVLSGTDPLAIRRVLRNTLPRAPPPEKQAIQQPAILHTTLARLLHGPKPQVAASFHRRALQGATLLQDVSQRMTDALCGLQATISHMWYVEEDDLLALAIGGQFRHQAIPFECKSGLSGQPQSE
eukprot:jgi/Botrbrau1/5116/Bobra.0128s0024.1